MISIIRDVVVIEESYVKHSVIEKKGTRVKRLATSGSHLLSRLQKEAVGQKRPETCTDDVATALRN